MKCKHGRKPMGIEDQEDRSVDHALDWMIDVERKRLREELRFRTELSRVVTSYTSPEELLPSVLEVLSDGFGASGGAVYYMEKFGDRIEVKATRGLDPSYSEKYKEIDLGSHLTGRAAKTGKAILVKDAEKDSRSTTGVVSMLHYRSALVTPVLTQDKVVGVIALIHEEPNRFSEDDLDLLESVSGHISLAIVNSFLNRDMAEEKEKITSILGGSHEGIFEALIMPSERGSEEDEVELLLDKSRFTLINSSFSSQAGEPLEIGDSLWKGFNNEMLPIYLTKVVKNGYFEGLEKNNVMGRIRVFELSMIRINDERGICGIKGLRKDITKSVMMQKRLERSKSKMELYLDLLSHDVSNINTVSQGFLELLLTMDDLTDISRRYLKSCLKAIQKSSHLVSKVKILARIESDLEGRKPVDLQPVIKHVLEAMRKEYPEKKLSVQMLKDESSMVVTCDNLIVDMVWHVIENAVMHDPSDNVSIDIQYEKYNLDGTEGSLISFSDRGPGIPNDLKSHIFNRKERKEDVRPGKGLGLVIIEGIVNRYGGTIWLEDRVMGDSGKGVKFSIFLPD